jgi:ABC-type multidrug transport system ATPase subunit
MEKKQDELVVESLDVVPSEEKSDGFSNLKMRNVHPIEVIWKNICLDVALPKGCKRGAPDTKRILNGVSGFTRPGEILAIMGSTGAGKTSLLNVLARRSEGEVSGTILVNGKAPGLSFKFAGYVS